MKYFFVLSNEGHAKTHVDDPKTKYEYLFGVSCFGVSTFGLESSGLLIMLLSTISPSLTISVDKAPSST